MLALQVLQLLPRVFLGLLAALAIVVAQLGLALGKVAVDGLAAVLVLTLHVLQLPHQAQAALERLALAGDENVVPPLRKVAVDAVELFVQVGAQVFHAPRQLQRLVEGVAHAPDDDVVPPLRRGALDVGQAAVQVGLEPPQLLQRLLAAAL